ncbi:MAG: alkaline phosphatase family protein [Clostridia bacterium]|nr:alkaline phosphatase family protein [Clostridia bacterium]
MKVILFLVDGMRYDSFEQFEKPKRYIAESAGSLRARTVYPPITLPSHVSIFHSVPPERHGITTNIFTPMADPVDGLFDILHAAGKKCAIFYNWDELRDLYRVGHIRHSYMARERSSELTNEYIAEEAVRYIKEFDPDFCFVYLGWVDAAGHDYGWMSERYLHAVQRSWDCIYHVLGVTDDSYTTIVTSDHGGHGRDHSDDIPEDMLVPVLFRGKDFEPGKEIPDLKTIDIAPTVARLLGVGIPENWEGTARV